MLNLSIPTWIANAAACLTGMYGDVTHQAEAADRSRQTVSDPAQKVQAAVEAEHSGGPTRAELIPEAQDLRQEDARPWDWLAQTIESPRPSNTSPPSRPRRWAWASIRSSSCWR